MLGTERFEIVWVFCVQCERGQSHEAPVIAHVEIPTLAYQDCTFYNIFDVLRVAAVRLVLRVGVPAELLFILPLPFNDHPALAVESTLISRFEFVRMNNWNSLYQPRAGVYANYTKETSNFSRRVDFKLFCSI